MARSASGTAILGAASIGLMLLVAACSGVENGPVIGTPAQASEPITETGSTLSLAGLQQQLASQVEQIDQTQSQPGNSVFAAQVDALVNDQALLSSERITQLQELGHNEVVTLEADLSSLTGAVEDTAGLSSAQAGAIEYVIRQVDDQLQSLDAKIATDTLVDVLRTDVLSVDSSTRVEGLIAPQVHIALGADSLLAAAALLTDQYTSLNKRVQANIGLNEITNQTTEGTLLNDLLGDISSMNSIGSSVAAQALALSPSGYPGNQGEMDTLKSELSSANSGVATAGHQDATAIGNCLTADQAQALCPQ